MDQNFFGQHIASEIILSALKGNFRRSIRNKKPLVMSFHGWPGCGKNFISDIIANCMFDSKKIKELRYHVINGASDHMEYTNLYEYKVSILHILFKEFIHISTHFSYKKIFLNTSLFRQ